MEVSAEAKRIMVVALGKLYSSRTQRGGLRLHRSLLLTRVMKSARDMYHAAQATTATDVASGCEPHQTSRSTAGPDGVRPEPRGIASPAAGTPPTSPRGERRHARAGARATADAENKENRSPPVPGQRSRKRRAAAAAAPDFLPCKKAKLDRTACPQPLTVNPAPTDYVNCGSEWLAAPTPVPLRRAVAAC